MDGPNDAPTGRDSSSAIDVVKDDGGSSVTGGDARAETPMVGDGGTEAPIVDDAGADAALDLPGSDLAAADLAGATLDTNLEGPRLSLSPTAQPFDVGEVAVGKTGAYKYLRIINIGAAATGPLTVTSESPQFVIPYDQCQGESLGISGSCLIGVALQPTGEGTIEGVVTVTDGELARINIAVVGKGTPYCLLTTEPESLDFGSWPVGSTSPPTNVTVTNTGGTPSGALVVVVNRARFSITVDTCTGVSLNPGESCTLSVVFKAEPMSSPGSQITITPEVGAAVVIPLDGNGIS